MKKTYKIEVDCANCANLMEDAAKKTAGCKRTVNCQISKIQKFKRDKHAKSHYSPNYALCNIARKL